jgi:hypothetical protein
VTGYERNEWEMCESGEIGTTASELWWKYAILRMKSDPGTIKPRFSYLKGDPGLVVNNYLS